MPPLPLNFTDVPVTRNPRTRLNFEQPTTFKHLQNEADGQENYIRSCVITESVKRCQESFAVTPSAKRRRFQFFTSTPKPETVTKSISPLSKIIETVEKLSTESELVADGSRANILPTITGKHSDLSAISPETMSDVLDGVYDNRLDKVTIIDCRYPYEYNSGHIKGAINLYTKETIQKFLQESVTSSATNHVLIFHCEFSSERGPKMYRFLRSLDRDMNKDNYPRLNFPEIYLLEGGYKAFFYTCKEKCHPQTYKPMLHNGHKEDLRHFRVKSKSWSAGDKPHKASIIGTGLRLRF